MNETMEALYWINAQVTLIGWVCGCHVFHKGHAQAGIKLAHMST